jgi:RHH-type transcriptional regulator, rel operon repressor / antitoxin RelB
MAKVLNVRISDAMAAKLDTLAQKTKRPKSFYLKEMLEQYIDEYADAYLALERLNDKNSKYLTTKELEKRLEL